MPFDGRSRGRRACLPATHPPLQACAMALAVHRSRVQQVSESTGTQPKLIKLIAAALEMNVEQNELQERLTSSTVSRGACLRRHAQNGRRLVLGGVLHNLRASASAAAAWTSVCMRVRPVRPAWLHGPSSCAGRQPAHDAYGQAHGVPRAAAAAHIPPSLRRAPGKVHEVQPRVLHHLASLHGSARTGKRAGDARGHCRAACGAWCTSNPRCFLGCKSATHAVWCGKRPSLGACFLGNATFYDFGPLPRAPAA